METLDLAELREVLRDVGEKIADARDARDWTQADLAGRCGVEYGTVGRWENGAAWPWGITYRKLLRALPEIEADLKRGATAAQKVRIASRQASKGKKRPPTASGAKAARRAAAAARAATKAKGKPKDRRTGEG